jgi:hypothetical protein
MPGVEDIASFWRADSRFAWVGFMEPFGDGETGKISVDSSKKVGSGIGCRVIPALWVVLASSVVVLVLRVASGLLPVSSWSGWVSWEVFVSWLSALGSFAALLPVGCF